MRTQAMLNYMHLSAMFFLGALKKNSTYPAHEQYYTTHKKGTVDLPSGESIGFTSLWDTGASNANYISSEFYEKNEASLSPFVLPMKSSVTLGDRKTTLHLDSGLNLPISFFDDDGVKHEAMCDFMILPSAGRDMIIGMPSLITDFGAMFLRTIAEAVDKYNTSSNTGLNFSNNSFVHKNQAKKNVEAVNEINPVTLLRPYVTKKIEGPLHAKKTAFSFSDFSAVDSDIPIPEGCVYPWSKSSEYEVCPEDDLIPEAGNAHIFLDFLTNSYDEEREKFLAALDEHISAEFLAECPEVRHLMQQHIDVFVKKTWEGLKLPPTTLKFRETMPARIKPYATKIPPALVQPARAEFERMLGYFYEASDSPWASPLVVASKATAPFIRLCVNMRKVNQYIEFGHQPIPNVQSTLQSLLPYKYFIDLDLRSAFHQILLDFDTSQRLSVQTPWGQYRPKFLPEGVNAATGILQKAMQDIFGDLGDWCYLLFDNVLLGGTSYKDCYEKLAIFLQRAAEFNVYLKIEKSWLGLKEVKFFGYLVREGCYYLEESRASAIDAIPFPSGTPATCQTAMRSFLGQTRIFQPHLPDYTTYSGPLDAMTSSTFNWNDSTWTEDYRSIFENFKLKLKGAMALFMPDYHLEWILRTDASNTGYGGVLYQVPITDEGVKEYQPLKFISKKWSDAATRWDTYSQECYGIFACVKECDYLLRGKPFIIETDHNNLRWMEASEVPKIIRQHLYLRTFTCWIRHIPGKMNTADYWSRLIAATTPESIEDRSGGGEGRELDALEAIFRDLLTMDDTDLDFWNDSEWLDSTLESIPELYARDATQVAPTAEVTTEDDVTAEALFNSVHGGKMLHSGTRRTWLLLNKLYPAHKIPIKKVQEMVDNCATCQKFRVGIRDQLTPHTRVLKPPHHRHTVGIDTLTITPPSEDGYKYIITMVNHYTHHVYLYPAKTHDSENIANALMGYIGNFGLFDELASDPGSDITSQAIKELNSWLGLRHKVSLVDVHTSNGCENTNKQIIQHLSTLVNDLRVKNHWANPKIISLIQLHFNSAHSSEAGIIPFQALFGSADSTYYQLPAELKPREYQTEYVKRLDACLQHLREISAKHQKAIAEKRMSNDSELRQFQKGDLVLKTVRTDTKHWKKDKLGPNFTGPWKIIKAHRNDYVVEHVTQGIRAEFHVSMLKPYFGTMEMAVKAALLDHDQFVVNKILYYTGDPSMRDTLEFYVQYADGDERWMSYSKDLFDCEAYEAYCKTRPELWFCVYTVADARKFRSKVNKEPITELHAGDTIYVDLRAIGISWYNGLGKGSLTPVLPNEDENTYVLKCKVTEWANNQQTKVKVWCDCLKLEFLWNHERVLCWGRYSKLTTDMTLVDEEFLKQYPQVVTCSKKFRTGGERVVERERV